LTQRIKNVFYYFGIGIFDLLLQRKKKQMIASNPHFNQMLMLSLLLFLSFLLFFLILIVQSSILLFSRELAAVIPLEIAFYILGFFLLIFAVIWLEGCLTAIIGLCPRISLYRWVEQNAFRSFILRIIAVVQLVLIFTTPFLALHADSLAKTSIDDSRIVFLYDDMGSIPRWVFTLGFYPELFYSHNRWGKGSAAVAELTKENLEAAFENSTFVFVSSHGEYGHIYLSNGMPYRPNELSKLQVNPALQYVYLTGCDTGLLKEQWQSGLVPAQVKTFGRLSTTLEHIFWLWFQGPDVLKALY
jgi:elongation factor P hydroxylase